MESYFLKEDITVFYIVADSFPDGALAAHQKLHALIPYPDKRRYFGISNPDKSGAISYRAAAEQVTAEESKQLNLKTLVLKRGVYTSTVIKGYQKNIAGIGKAFNTLLSNPDIDPEGYCVEWYLNDEDVQCMVRLTT